MPRANVSTSKSSASAAAICDESHDAYAVVNYAAHAGVHELPKHAQGTRRESPPGGCELGDCGAAVARPRCSSSSCGGQSTHPPGWP